MVNSINNIHESFLRTLEKKGYLKLVKISETAEVYKGQKNGKEYSIKMSDKRNIDWKLLSKIVTKLIKEGVSIIKPVDIFDFEDKEIIVCEYIPGNPPTDNTEISEFVTNLYDKVIQIPIDQRNLDELAKEKTDYFKSKFQSHLETILNSDIHFKTTTKTLARYKDLYSLASGDLSYQHGDLCLKNIIHSKKDSKNYLIDINSLAINSRYFDTAIFLAKTLANPTLTKYIYKNMENKLEAKDFIKFNLQLIFAIIKDYKNIHQLPVELKNLPKFKKSYSILGNKILEINKNLELTKSLNIKIL